MAKKYDFHFVVRKAQFTETDGVKFVTVPYGAMASVYHEECGELTYADAQKRLAELSEAEPRSHVAFLRMKYREDRVPPGFNKNPNRIQKEGR